MTGTRPKTIERIEKVREDFNDLVAKGRYPMNEIISKRRDAEIVNARQKIAKALRDKGYSYPLIALAMERDHTSIMHLCNWRKKKEK